LALTIGVRFYRIRLHKNGEHGIANIAEQFGESKFLGFLRSYAEDRREPTNEEEHQRSWFFEPKAHTEDDTIHGLMKYGTFGFESRILDNKTKEHRYTRLPTDLEEVPLYFQFWYPDSSDYAYFAFQSFQGRSCVTLVMANLIEVFERANPGWKLRYSKVAPNTKGALLKKPVKSVKLTRSAPSSDQFDAYLKDVNRHEIDVELTIKAKRNKFLGRLEDMVVLEVLRMVTLFTKAPITTPLLRW